MHKLLTALAGILLGLTMLLAAPALAQSSNGCTVQVLSDPPRKAFECEGGLVLEAEALENEGFAIQSLEVGATSLDLDKGAILIHVAPGTETFQILTPHAIASVRGTKFTVDATDETTSVFVVEGWVQVTDRGKTGLVDLKPGEGIVVTAGEPLLVSTWPQDKVTALMARFGQ